jgi:hypothetical protein
LEETSWPRTAVADAGVDVVVVDDVDVVEMLRLGGKLKKKEFLVVDADVTAGNDDDGDDF